MNLRKGIKHHLSGLLFWPINHGIFTHYHWFALFFPFLFSSCWKFLWFVLCWLTLCRNELVQFWNIQVAHSANPSQSYYFVSCTDSNERLVISKSKTVITCSSVHSELPFFSSQVHFLLTLLVHPRITWTK